MKNETDKVAPILPSVLPIVAKSTTGDEALMAFCDRRFGKLMHSSLVNPPVDAAPASTFSEEEQALARYRQVRDRAGCVPSPRIQQGKCEKTRLALGVGPRVFIGFDAEWQFLRKGRNRILSVQFCLIGPSGEIMYKVIHLDNHDTERPSLSQAIYELLDEAVEDGIIDDWPIEVVLCGFFTRADITVFSDFKKFRHELSGVGGTLVTVGEAVDIELPMSEKRQQQLKSHYQYVVGSMVDPKLLSIRLVDSSRLAPPGKSLAYLGKVLGLPKIELPTGFDKSDMASFQRKEKKKFEAYGLRDAEIAVTYVLWVVWFSTRYLGLNMDRLSATASGLAVRVAEACIRSDGVALNVALNFEEKQVTRWDNKNNRARVQKKRVPKRTRGWLEAFLADAYVGGRNECYMFGPTAIKRFFDPDLSGAYLTALAYLLVLDYDEAFMTKEVKDFIGPVAGYALVSFKFPTGTRFPCLPVAVEERGLLFPLTGESLCTAPEIELAQNMGAEIVIKYGVVIPWMAREDVFSRSALAAGKRTEKKMKSGGSIGQSPDDDAFEFDDAYFKGGGDAFAGMNENEGYRLFESFAAFIRERRQLFTRKTLAFEFIKLLGNSLYGKTGQGFKQKRTFGPKEMDSVVVGPSRVSEAAVAGLVCGLIRAVIGEILWKLPADVTAVSATTDGFLVDCPIEQLDVRDRIVQGALVEYLGGKYAEKLANTISFGFIKGRSVHMAAYIACESRRERPWVYKTDITAFFDSIPRADLQYAIKKLIKERSLHAMLFAALDCEVDSPSRAIATDIAKLGIKRGLGVRQGMPLSPFFSNLLLVDFDQKVELSGASAVRYADDLIFLCRDEYECDQVATFCKSEFNKIGLDVPPLGLGSKSVIYSPDHSAEFLGLELAPAAIGYELRLADDQLLRLKQELLGFSNIKQLLSRNITLRTLGQTIAAKLNGYLGAYDICTNIDDVQLELRKAEHKALRTLYGAGLGIKLSEIGADARAFLGLPRKP